VLGKPIALSTGKSCPTFEQLGPAEKRFMPQAPSRRMVLELLGFFYPVENTTKVLRQHVCLEIVLPVYAKKT